MVPHSHLLSKDRQLPRRDPVECYQSRGGVEEVDTGLEGAEMFEKYAYDANPHCEISL